MEKIDIMSAQYAEFKNEIVNIKATINGQEMFIPLDPANRHYAEIMRQVEAGELTIQEAADAVELQENN